MAGGPLTRLPDPLHGRARRAGGGGHRRPVGYRRGSRISSSSGRIAAPTATVSPPKVDGSSSNCEPGRSSELARTAVSMRPARASISRMPTQPPTTIRAGLVRLTRFARP